MSFIKEKKSELVVAAIVGIAGFLFGQSFQAIENKAAMDSKNYVEERMRELRIEMDAKIDNLSRDAINVLINSAKTVSSAEDSLKKSELIIDNADNALTIIKRKERDLENILRKTKGIDAESIAPLVKSDVFSALSAELNQLAERFPKCAYITTRTNDKGIFSAAHSLDKNIRGILVSIQHKNGNWHTLEISNRSSNRFWFNNSNINGQIETGDFANVEVKILAFYN